MSIKPKVALSQDFLLNLPAPGAVQGKVLKWAIRFQTDPTASGFNYEKIRAARDPTCGPSASTGTGGDCLCATQERPVHFAVRGSPRRGLSLGREPQADHQPGHRGHAGGAGGGSECSASASGIRGEAAPDEIDERQLLFAALSDADLLSLGTPADLLPRVRQITSEAELDALQPVLPIEAYEGLFLVAAGDTVSQVLSARETQVDRLIDTEDFARSVETAESQSRFVVVDNDEALTAIMNAPLAQWRVFLHPLQKRLAVGDRSGPVRVLGGAGTGKPSWPCTVPNGWQNMPRPRARRCW